MKASGKATKSQRREKSRSSRGSQKSYPGFEQTVFLQPEKRYGTNLVSKKEEFKVYYANIP
jgi:hypothetical protein